MEKEKIEILTSELIKTKCSIIISGPTASGKTSLALRLSDLLPIEVVSADSRQIYKFLNIGTAKPTIEELNKVKHHFIDYIEPEFDYSAGQFGDEAFSCIEDIFNRDKIPVVVGGSGLYIKSLLYGLFDSDNSNKEEVIKIRAELQELLEKKGKEHLYDELLLKDKESAILYPDKNPRRILRALEYFYLTGNSITKSRLDKKIERKLNFIQFGINLERERLYKLINERVLKMWSDGLLNEYKDILKKGFSEQLNSLNTVGYKECQLYLTGYLSEDETISEIQKNTRHYAKRQLTWFKKDESIIWLDANDKDIVCTDDLLNYLFERNKIEG